MYLTSYRPWWRSEYLRPSTRCWHADRRRIVCFLLQYLSSCPGLLSLYSFVLQHSNKSVQCSLPYSKLCNLSWWLQHIAYWCFCPISPLYFLFWLWFEMVLTCDSIGTEAVGVVDISSWSENHLGHVIDEGIVLSLHICKELRYEKIKW